MSSEVQKNKIRGDYIVENFTIGELTFQKKRQTAPQYNSEAVINQIPFSLGVGTGHRARGIPYVVSTSEPDKLFPDTRHSFSDPNYIRPILYYKFEEGTGAVIRNDGTSGSNFDLTASTYGGGSAQFHWTPSSSPFVYSGSYSIQLNKNDKSGGGDAFMESALVPKLENGSWTMSVWARTEGPWNMNIWFQGQAGSSENTMRGLYLVGDNSLKFIAGSSSPKIVTSSAVTSTGNPRDGGWHHYVMTYDHTLQDSDETQTSKIYFDGVDVTLSCSYDGSGNGESAQGLKFGRGLHTVTGSSSDTKHWTGSMDEIALWDYAFKAEEVDELYNTTLDALHVLDLPEKVYD